MTDLLNPSILVVDDQPENRLLMTEYLFDLGLEIDEAESGEKCLELLKKKAYTLVLMDVQMPGLNGYDVLEKMRENVKLAEVPVVFVSTVYDSDQHILKGITGGAIDFIAKPVNIDILKSKVSNFIKLYEKQTKLDQLVKRLEQVNQRLKENERKFKGITKSASDSIILLDEFYRIRFWNQASRVIFGYVKYEILSENFFELLISNDSRKPLLDYFDLVLKTSGNMLNKSIQLMAINKTGFEFPVELSLSYFNTAENKTNYTVIIRDIAHRLKIEKEALNAKELNETNKVMKEFMDNVSHELRTPMNAILGISNMLIKYNAENLLPKQIEGLQIINQSGTRLLDLVNDVLELSTIEADKIQINKEPFELDKLLATLRSMVISLIDKKDIKFIITKSLDVPEIINTDHRKLNQILINLLGNSVKFTQLGKINLYIHYLDQKLYFEVADTGIGISKENLSIIFDRFRQIDNSETKEYKGTGLGLNISKRLIELLGGNITVESTLNKGTMMRFYLPLDKILKKDGTHTEELIKSISKQVNDEINVKLPLAVIIDDNEQNCYLYSMLLKENGYSVISCLNSSTGFIAIKQYIPDLVILKFEMPKIHGQFIIHQISEFDYLTYTKFLIITSIENLNLQNIVNPYAILNEPVSEMDLIKLIDKRKIPVKPKFITKYLFICETVDYKNVIDKYFNCFQNLSFHSAKLIVSRRNIQELVLDGFVENGKNLELINWISVNMDYAPYKLIVIHEQQNNKITGLLVNPENYIPQALKSRTEILSINEVIQRFQH